METIYLLIPLALVLVALLVWVFFWAVRSGQFDDLEGPAYRILMDEEGAPPERKTAPHGEGRDEVSGERNKPQMNADRRR